MPRILKKILVLETDPNAGLPLSDEMTGYRKLVVGNRDWRVVYRVAADGPIEVCEIWAAGARSDEAVYAEAMTRVRAAIDKRPELMSFADVVARLGRLAGVELTEAGLASREEPVPDWLAERLVNTAGVPPVEVAAMDARTAFDAWNAYIARPAEDP